MWRRSACWGAEAMGSCPSVKSRCKALLVIRKHYMKDLWFHAVKFSVFQINMFMSGSVENIFCSIMLNCSVTGMSALCLELIEICPQQQDWHLLTVAGILESVTVSNEIVSVLPLTCALCPWYYLCMYVCAYLYIIMLQWWQELLLGLLGMECQAPSPPFALIPFLPTQTFNPKPTLF